MALVVDTTSDPYPVDALPGAIGEAVREVEAFVQCPAALAACSALSAVSLCAQGLVNVRRGWGLEGPLSLYFLPIAGSGDRKSECDRRFMAVVRAWEAEQVVLVEPDVANYRAALAAWEAEREAVLLQVKQARKSGESTEEARRALAELACTSRAGTNPAPAARKRRRSRWRGISPGPTAGRSADSCRAKPGSSSAVIRCARTPGCAHSRSSTSSGAENRIA